MKDMEVLIYSKSYYSARTKLEAVRKIKSGGGDFDLEVGAAAPQAIIAKSERRVECWLKFFGGVGLLLLVCYYFRWPSYKKNIKKKTLLPIHSVFKRNHD